MTMTLQNYMSRKVHETLNGVNQSSSFRDMRSTKSGPNMWQIWQVFGPWASSYGANGQLTMAVRNYMPRQFHRPSNGEKPSSGYSDMVPHFWQPPARPTIPFQPEGLRGKKAIPKCLTQIFYPCVLEFFLKAKSILICLIYTVVKQFSI